MKLSELKKEIDGMSQIEMARLWRFAPSEKCMFTPNKQDDQELQEYFSKKFKEKGGMTPSVSKRIGWD